MLFSNVFLKKKILWRAAVQSLMKLLIKIQKSIQSNPIILFGRNVNCWIVQARLRFVASRCQNG